MQTCPVLLPISPSGKPFGTMSSSSDHVSSDLDLSVPLLARAAGDDNAASASASVAHPEGVLERMQSAPPPALAPQNPTSAGWSASSPARSPPPPARAHLSSYERILLPRGFTAETNAMSNARQGGQGRGGAPPNAAHTQMFRPPPPTLRSSAMEPVCRFIQIFRDGSTRRHSGTRRAILAKCTSESFGGRAVRMRDADIRLLLGNPLEDDRLLTLKSDGQPLVMLRRERVGIVCLGSLRLAVTNEWALIVIPPTGPNAHTNSAAEAARQWAQGSDETLAHVREPSALPHFMSGKRGRRAMRKDAQQGAESTYAALALYHALSHSSVSAPEEFAAHLASKLKAARHKKIARRAAAAAHSDVVGYDTRDDGMFVSKHMASLSQLSTSLSANRENDVDASFFSPMMPSRIPRPGSTNELDDLVATPGSDNDNDDNGNNNSSSPSTDDPRDDDHMDAAALGENDESLPFEASVVDTMLDFTGRALLEATQALTLASRPAVTALSMPRGFTVTEGVLDAVRKVKGCQASLASDAIANHQSLERFLDAADQNYHDQEVHVEGGEYHRRTSSSLPRAMGEYGNSVGRGLGGESQIKEIGLLVLPNMGSRHSSEEGMYQGPTSAPVPAAATTRGGRGGSNGLPPKLPNQHPGPWHAGTNTNILEALEGHLRTYSYAKQLLKNVESALEDAEEIANLYLDATRNQLIRLELLLTLAALSIAVYGLVAGVFGMNVPIPNELKHRHAEECMSRYWGFVAQCVCDPFYYINILSTTISAAIFTVTFVVWNSKGWV